MGGGGDGEDLLGGAVGEGVEPDDDSFPVVAVAEAGGRGVFGEVPGVHDGGASVVGAGAGVDLAGAAGAVAVGGASDVEAAAVFEGGKKESVLECIFFFGTVERSCIREDPWSIDCRSRMCSRGTR